MPKTLLLADDSVTIQKVVGISFANEDIQLLTVDNGDDAITRAREARPDVVLADAVMPGKDGYEVCEAIKQDPNLRHIPVLLLTGTFETFDEERAQAVGIDGHITKPFEAQALVEQVNRLLERTQATAPPAAPAATPTAPAVPESSAAEATVVGLDAVQAYDFFDEDLTELSPGAQGAGARPAAADRTIAILPDAPASPQSTEAMLGDSGYDIFEGAEDPHDLPMADDDLASLELPGEDSGAARDPLAAPQNDPEATQFSDNAFEFGVEDAPPPLDAPDAIGGELAAGNLGQQAIIDPSGASGFDVSVSDLGDPLASATTAGDPAAASTRPGASTPPSATQRAAPPTAVQPAAPAPERAAPGGGLELSPAVRQQLHDTLEKVAWEAFSDLSETVVRQVLERVETIAWEVIPQMAEALIRDEIRRMKGEPEKS